MASNSIKILCTRPLKATLIDEAQEEGISIHISPFIDTIPIQTIEVQQEIEQALLQTATVVFTSMNAVEAVAYYQDETEPDWVIYCMGNTTGKLVRKYFGEHRIAGTADDAQTLAGLIAEEGLTDEVIFFCGDQRRDELPGVLSAEGIEVNEIMVYQTIALPHKVDNGYHGILFFSPSAVDSFFKKNKLPPATVLFAIGTTTAGEIKKHTNNKIITANQPGKENLVKLMIDYFTAR